MKISMFDNLKHWQQNILLLFLAVFFFLPNEIFAASLSISPSTGVYTTGNTFSVRVVVNTAGQPINAAEGTINFNPKEVSVVSVDRSNSIFNLWVTEPKFSNTAGTINFSGGLPSGYTGSSGTVFTITFRTISAATARVSLTGGSVLANDGRGTNVLSGMNGGTYTIQAQSSTPAPEVVEYVAPANTPAQPKIQSSTHANQEEWYQAKRAELSWDLPSGIIAVRTLLDKNQFSIPTKVYEEPIRNITLEDLPEGISYFHLQFKNEDGWGKVAHYRLAVDTLKPSNFNISLLENADLSNPVQKLKLDITDEGSGVNRYKVRVDNAEAYDFEDEEGTGVIELSSLSPEYHSIIIEAFDRAGNSIISTFSFTISSFDRPIFTEYPNEINEEVIPVIRGLTRPKATVEITMQKIGFDAVSSVVTAGDDGVFTFIPEGTLSTGVYELTARATDQFGAQSDSSEVIRIAVQQPGYIQVGNMLINVLSVVIPLMAMVVLLVLAAWFLVLYLRRFRKKVSVESGEVVQILHSEFARLHALVEEQKTTIAESRKTNKLTKAEELMFSTLIKAIKDAEVRVDKEADDVEKLVKKKIK